MKRFFLIAFIYGIHFTMLMGQDFKCKLIAIDSFGNKDSVVFGMGYNATLGIDSSLHEINILNQPFSDLDIRIIQRDSIHLHCLNGLNWVSTGNIYSPNNIDSKIDIRPFAFLNNFADINDNFEIVIHAINFPVIITTDFSQISGSYLEGWSTLHLLDTNCQSIQMENIYFNFIGDTIFTLNDSVHNTLVANIQHEVGINDNKFKNQIEIVYPNPTHNNLTINYDGEIMVELIDLRGNCIIKTRSKNLDISNFSSSLYFLKIIDLQTNKLLCKKIIKN